MKKSIGILIALLLAFSCTGFATQEAVIFPDANLEKKIMEKIMQGFRQSHAVTGSLLKRRQ